VNNVKTLDEYKEQSFKGQLRNLYSALEKIKPGNCPEDRVAHARRFQGQFISIFRQKSNLLFIDVSSLTGIKPEKLYCIENGEIRIEDSEFFKLCHVLGATNEVSVFLERLEEAFTPGLRDARRNSSETLAALGFTFASHPPKATLQSSHGKVLSFGKKPFKSVRHINER
jgi:hypothetical protein